MCRDPVAWQTNNDACFVRDIYNLGGLPGRELRETGLPPPGYKATYIRTSSPHYMNPSTHPSMGDGKAQLGKRELTSGIQWWTKLCEKPIIRQYQVDYNWKKSNWTWRSPLAVTVWTTPCPGSTAVALKDLQQDHQRWRCSTGKDLNFELSHLQQIMEKAFNKWF